jgi:hypothetical protein
MEAIDLKLTEPVAAIFDLVGSDTSMIEKNGCINLRVMHVKVFNEIFNNPTIV